MVFNLFPSWIPPPPVCLSLSLLPLSLSAAVRDHLDSEHTQHKRTSPLTTSNSQMCTFSGQSCHFYSHCIDSHFHCGPLGFSQAYAKARCEATYNLQQSQEPCASCISDVRLYDWARDQESCLKQKLLEVVESEYTTMHSDPPNCLRLEHRGLELMQECYDEQAPAFCSALNDNPSIVQDIKKIAAVFRINDYYTTQVERALSNLVRNCDGAHEELADSLLTVNGAHSPRIVLCGTINEASQNHINHSRAVRLVADRLLRPREEFEFSGLDNEERCIQGYRYPIEFTPSGNEELLFIMWRPSQANDPLIDSLGTDLYTQDDPDADATVGFYQYTPLRSREDFPECGDGERQAGELCDMGVENGGDYCDFECQPALSKECSTEQFQRSECWWVRCGDGVRSAGEECDDNNYHLGDGCSSSCRVEPDYTCSGHYNGTSECVHHSETPEPTTYPPATTAAPSSPSTSHTSSISRLPPSSIPSLASDGSSEPHVDTATPPLGISAAPSSLHSRSVVLQSLVSVLLTCLTVYVLAAR